MSTTQLTDCQFWFDYWESKSRLAFEVGGQYPFIQDLDTFTQKNNVPTLLEIGGFPGYFSVWVAWHRQVESTLFNFVIHPGILRRKGRFMLWIENLEQQPWRVRSSLRAVWLPLKTFLKPIPVETRFFFPYLLPTARV